MQKIRKMSMFCSILSVAVAAVFSFGLSGCNFNSGNVVQENAVLVAVELGAYNLGYYVGKSKTDDDDEAIAKAYALAREGKLAPETVAEAMKKLKIENPQLAGSLNIMLKRTGAKFDADGGLVDISGIDLKYWDRAAEGYASGYAFGKVNKKAKGKTLGATAKSKVEAVR